MGTYNILKKGGQQATTVMGKLWVQRHPLGMLLLHTHTEQYRPGVLKLYWDPHVAQKPHYPASPDDPEFRGHFHRRPNVLWTPGSLQTPV